MDKIKKYETLADVYQQNMEGMLEKIASELWNDTISEEENNYIFLAKKLAKLDPKGYVLMLNKYNILNNVREAAWIVQLKLNQQQNIKRIVPFKK